MVREQNATLVLGAGVSMSATNHKFASWFGLLRDGIEHCGNYGTPPLNEDSVAKYINILESGDVDSWLAIATVIERKLKYPNNQEWSSWLHGTIGKLQAKNTNLIEAILSLNLPILTTNYDDILSQRILSKPRTSLTWNDRSSFTHFMSNPLDYIFHLHGSYLKSDSVIFGMSSYEHLLGTESAQHLQQVLTLCGGLVFIGYGSGFDDPNFKPFIEFISKHGSWFPNQRHFVLVKSGDEEYFSNIPNIYPVIYGDDYEELPVFIRSLPYGQERYVFNAKRFHAESLNHRERFRDIGYCPEMVFISSSEIERIASKSHYKFKDIAIGAEPITVKDWEVFVAEKGSFYKKFLMSDYAGDLPITGVTYFDALDYCKWLTEITGYKYRLPTAAEWESIALLGLENQSLQSRNNSSANCRQSGNGKLTSTNLYPPNCLGIYDMQGNAWEWTSTEPKTTKLSGSVRERILKGGCFYYDESYLSPESKIAIEEDAVFNSVGFRVVREIDDMLEDGREYYILSILSPLALTAEDDMAVGISEFNMSEQQKWRINVHNEWYSLTSVSNKKSISYSDSLPKDYDKVNLTSKVRKCSHFRIEKSFGGYTLKSREGNKSIDLEGSKIQGKPELIFFEPHGNFNQCWHLVPCE